MKRTIFVGLVSAALASSTGCGLLEGLLCGCGPCGGCGPGGVVAGCGCSDCGSDCGAACAAPCGPACGDGCGCGPAARRCGHGCTACGGWGCGERYWGDFYSDPPEVFDPCDNCGNWTGRSNCGCAATGAPQGAYMASAKPRAKAVRPQLAARPTPAADVE